MYEKLQQIRVRYYRFELQFLEKAERFCEAAVREFREAQLELKESIQEILEARNH